MMKQATWIALAASTALVVTTTNPAEAAGVKWNLQGATVNYGGRNYGVTGSFVYDDASNSYSDINIESAFTAIYNGPAAALIDDRQLNLSEVFGSTLNYTLGLRFSESLVGKTAGAIPLDLTGSTERRFGTLGGISINDVARFTKGSIVTDSIATVPAPALLPGFVGIGIAAIRKRKAEVEV